MSKPLHPKAREFERTTFFAGVKTFAALEARIAALPDEKARGDAFEVFAEVYLATQRKHDASEIWPLSVASLGLLAELGLSSNDQGVDGIFKTVLGQFSVYQVKFRSNRQPLTWRELSTFMGLADSARIRSRVLFTNCDDLPAVMNDRMGFFCIRGSDLDRLEESDFQAIEKWLAHAVVQRTPKQPRPHQQDALNVLLPALREQDRVTAIMACGTGKTLVALWIAERLSNCGGASVLASRDSAFVADQEVTARQEPRPTNSRDFKILVLLPSLALLRQTLHEWLHETSLPALTYLCVCSDPSVKADLDAIATPQSDLDFPVTTERRSVREFLGAPFAGVKVIFSTYQSARVVGEALRKSEAFDLGIFDEAHKTAGRDGRNYAFALEDANLPIRKRLFLTATPRHYNPQRRDKEGDAQLVFSMDKPAAYGPQAFRLTFAEAARRGIICNYKVIISVITSGQVTNELLSRGETLVNGDLVRARQVANQIALQDAITKYGVNKVFTFHRTVQSAASFVSAGTEGIGTHFATIGRAALPRRPDQKKWAARQHSPTDEFQTFHVNGTMPTARRERVMRDFRAAPRGLVSNARCLTEGVDVPAVDMVAFLSPRRSRVDIVQATGRAMRRAPGKTTGYVLVPLYLEQAAGETIEQAVFRAEFDEVWDVLQSLQEQDEVLAEIIREMREERGRTKGFDDARFRERVEILGLKLSLEKLRRTIGIACVEALADDWEESFGELNAFKQRLGHTNVPNKWRENPRLARWVIKQRQARKAGHLSESRSRRLEAIEFVWEPHTRSWQEMFAALLRFKEQHGHCNVSSCQAENLDLHRWVLWQRHCEKQGTLSNERIRRLNEVCFVWEGRVAIWEEMFSALLKYYYKRGNCNVPQRWPENQKLATWVSRQRSQMKVGKLGKERINRFRRIGFVWDSDDAFWEEMFDALIAFKRAHGDCNVPSVWPEDPRLGTWAHQQRRLKKTGRLSSSRVRRLRKARFIWNPQDATWDEMFAVLQRYQREHGHCDVPRSNENSKLARWVLRQRRSNKTGTLNRTRAKRLGALGFIWDSNRARHESMFRALLDYRREHGDCNVPEGWRGSPGLAIWVATRRRTKKAGKLDNRMIKRLNAIGFQWEFKRTPDRSVVTEPSETNASTGLRS